MSTASITEAILAELGTPCERVNLDISADDTRLPDFLKTNPNGRVLAIAMYFGEVFGVDAKLYPTPGPKRGEEMKRNSWSNITLVEPASRLSAMLPTSSEGSVQPNSLDWVQPEQRSEITVEKAKTDLANCLKILDGKLEGRAFLLGDYSLADTYLQGIVGWIGSMDVDLKPLSNVTGWLKRCHERPVLAKLMAG